MGNWCLRRVASRLSVWTLLLLLCLPAAGYAVESAGRGEAEEFDPASMVFSHIYDAYEWHIFAIGDFHLTIPLPVMLISREGTGFHCFSSSRFEGGRAVYDNFAVRVGKGAEAKPRIVELDASGKELSAPIDLSMTKNVVAILFSCLLMLWVFIAAARAYRPDRPSAPHGLQNAVELMVIFVRDQVARVALPAQKVDRYLPFLLTVFFFILFNIILGLVPFFPAGASVTGNLTVTGTLALFTFLVTNLSGNRHYWRDIFNTPGMPIFMKLPVPMMPAVELMGIFIKPIVLMVRLFANMLAGHMVTLVLMSLIFLLGGIAAAAGYAISVISVAFGIFMILLDLLVSLVQAYVFALLSAVYIGMATEEPEHTGKEPVRAELLAK